MLEIEGVNSLAVFFLQHDQYIIQYTSCMTSTASFNLQMVWPVQHPFIYKLHDQYNILSNTNCMTSATSFHSHIVTQEAFKSHRQPANWFQFARMETNRYFLDVVDQSIVWLQVPASMWPLWEGNHKSRKCSMNTNPESCITNFSCIRRLFQAFFLRRISQYTRITKYTSIRRSPVHENERVPQCIPRSWGTQRTRLPSSSCSMTSTPSSNIQVAWPVQYPFIYKWHGQYNIIPLAAYESNSICANGSKSIVFLLGQAIVWL